ncbi:primase-helicase zinc-binding domain-containing protein [Acinetobacter sp. TUM15064]|uniref:primase-helicase zinc-binding domain-containing protein n=1 Tax=Acinetobacter sp. TUM15064 TaxID=2609134 RepID=UPI00124D4143|nr:primase-helicase zinc-binding domain-containing protein [Acinetobacter sp. TUM15064]
MALSFDQVRDAANGLWKSKIFPSFGIQVPASKNQHGPCPICARSPSTSSVSGKTLGKASNVDRFRCDDQQGNGSWICNVCGAGDGFSLVAQARGWTRKEVLNEIGTELGLSTEGKTNAADRTRWRNEAEARRKQAEADELKAKEAAAKNAKRRWAEKSHDRDCPYIERKQIKNFGCKINAKGNLIVPLFDIHGKIWNIQEIHADGHKPFLFGGRVSSCFFMIGHVTEQDQLICIAEGYATAASIHEATGHVTVVAFNSGNIDKVGKEIRSLHPYARLVYCADDDSHSEPPDAGLKAANKAVAATGGIVILPEFSQVVNV